MIPEKQFLKKLLNNHVWRINPSNSPPYSYDSIDIICEKIENRIKRLEKQEVKEQKELSKEDEE